MTDYYNKYKKYKSKYTAIQNGGYLICDNKFQKCVTDEKKTYECTNNDLECNGSIKCFGNMQKDIDSDDYFLFYDNNRMQKGKKCNLTNEKLDFKINTSNALNNYTFMEIFNLTPQNIPNVQHIFNNQNTEDHNPLINVYMSSIFPNLYLGRMFMDNNDFSKHIHFDLIIAATINEKSILYTKSYYDCGTCNKNIIVVEKVEKGKRVDNEPSGPLEDILATDIFYDKHIKEILTNIHQNLHKGKRVLVCCQQGLDRSVSIVVAYISLYYNIPWNIAYKFVKSKRNVDMTKKTFSDELDNFCNNFGIPQTL